MQTDLFCGIRNSFDVILFNPPYLPTQPEERINDWLEHALDGGLNGRVVIERFSQQVGHVLAPGGRILLLISSLTGLPEVRDLFFKAGFVSEIILRKNVEGETLYVLKIVRAGLDVLTIKQDEFRFSRGFFYYRSHYQPFPHQVDCNNAKDCSHQDNIYQIEHSHPAQIRQGEHPHNGNKMGKREAVQVQYTGRVLAAG